MCCRFNFYDGPPFATGLPHYGHILAGTIKDIVTRFAHQSGFHVDRRFGWDCHGLPVVCVINLSADISVGSYLHALTCLSITFLLLLCLAFLPKTKKKKSSLSTVLLWLLPVWWCRKHIHVGESPALLQALLIPINICLFGMYIIFLKIGEKQSHQSYPSKYLLSSGAVLMKSQKDKGGPLASLEFTKRE